MLDLLNEPQKEAVMHKDGPLLILAGAGSGKTRVLTQRAAYLIHEEGVNPYNIMAITFTNKAAAEMRERIDGIVGYGSESIWVSTFHSTCVRILRRYIDRLGMGYTTNFTIYDADDQKSLMKAVLKRLELDPKKYKEKTFLNAISSAKDELIDPIEFENRTGIDYNKKIQARVYAEYQRQLKENNALDFDDLISKTVELFRLDKEVLGTYQERFRYIMVDEYQDTNTAQFKLIHLLASKYKNLCVVGDDDQSIYKFRGANIYNILNFEKYFPEAKVIKLEQNYRSTQTILDAANAVIANNAGRKDKSLWTDKGAGEKIDFKEFDNAYEEARSVVFNIEGRVKKGEYNYRDNAILYRTNAQSRAFEECLISANIPYKIVGGINFYARKEIKDILGYLKCIDNPVDDLSVNRIINIPKRGIGATSIGKVTNYAFSNNISFYDALLDAKNIPTLGKAADKIAGFTDLMEEFKALASKGEISKLIDEVMTKTGYLAELEADDDEKSEERVENLYELVTKAKEYDEGHEDGSLSNFLEEVALVADLDSYDENSDYLVLMTIHSAKGLEFPNVYLVGMEDGLFPSYMSIMNPELDINGNNAEIEEERRLAYVAITRAMDHLTITAAKMRMLRGETQYNAVSRFVKEIPKDFLNGTYYEAKRYDDDYSSTSSYKSARNTLRTNSTSYSTSYSGNNSSFYNKTSKTPVFTPVSNQRSFDNDANDKNVLGYDVGDRVKHIKFGDGEVVAIVSGGRDFEVTVDFDKAGTKKMFAGFAKLKKID